MAALAVVLALVIGGAIGFAWHAPGRSTTWTDIRTWVGFAVVVIGVVIALVQLDLQRRQLAGQHRVIQDEVKRNRQRDALTSGQLLELEQRSLTYERQQAEQVDIKRSYLRTRLPGSDPAASHNVHAAEISDSSPRPIRNVACRIEAEPGDNLQEANTVGVLDEAVAGRARMLGLSDGTHIPLIRARETGAFIFSVDQADHPKARFTVRLTDDAGLHWQIDPDLHLNKLDNRDDW